jgi:YggT family protein
VTNHQVDLVERYVSSFVYVYILLVFVWVVMSWVRLPYSVWLYRVRGFVDDTVSPLMRVFRRLLPSLGGIDLSPLIAVVALSAGLRVALALLDQLRPGP